MGSQENFSEYESGDRPFNVRSRESFHDGEVRAQTDGNLCAGEITWRVGPLYMPTTVANTVAAPEREVFRGPLESTEG